ncbi:MAG: GFA family protein [Pseudomonadota bacterium]
MTQELTGRCLCGAVHFTIKGAVSAPVACHCRECQRHSGGMWVAVTAPSENVTIARERLAWVSVSARARRGFCRDCGGYLFWEPVGGTTIDVAYGALDDTKDLKLAAHIFTEECRLPEGDGLPRHEGEGPETVV